MEILLRGLALLACWFACLLVQQKAWGKRREATSSARVLWPASMIGHEKTEVRARTTEVFMQKTQISYPSSRNRTRACKGKNSICLLVVDLQQALPTLIVPSYP